MVRRVLIQLARRLNLMSMISIAALAGLFSGATTALAPLIGIPWDGSSTINSMFAPTGALASFLLLNIILIVGSTLEKPVSLSWYRLPQYSGKNGLGDNEVAVIDDSAQFECYVDIPDQSGALIEVDVERVFNVAGYGFSKDEARTLETSDIVRVDPAVEETDFILNLETAGGAAASSLPRNRYEVILSEKSRGLELGRITLVIT